MKLSMRRMSDTRYLDWPFFEEQHRRLARDADAWAAQHIGEDHGTDVNAECRALVRALGEAGWLKHAVAGAQYGGAADVIDTRSICLLRETLARYSGLADFALAMQGLGSGAISLQRRARSRSSTPRCSCGAVSAC